MINIILLHLYFNLLLTIYIIYLNNVFKLLFSSLSFYGWSIIKIIKFN